MASIVRYSTVERRFQCANDEIAAAQDVDVLGAHRERSVDIRLR